jgi:hypothetical protein
MTWMANAELACDAAAVDGPKNKERIKQGEEAGKTAKQSPQIPVIV